MNGAESLARTLIAHGVQVCFANPGTSEMHFVAALDRHPELRCVLGLFEGVVTGMADGYARMAGRPAATLLHTGPGLANGLANLHNAKKARTPVFNVVGDHASFHAGFETPLASDAPALAGPVSDWVRTASDAASVAALAAEGLAAACAYPGQVATLVLPADSAWNEVPVRSASSADADLGLGLELDGPVVTAASAATVTAASASASATTVDAALLDRAAHALRSREPTLLFLGAPALRAGALDAAGQLAAHCGCHLMSVLSATRIARGAGRVPVARIPYPPGPAREALAPYRHIVVVGAPAPVSFFGYPGQRSELWPPDCDLIDLGYDVDARAALDAMVQATGAAGTAPLAEPAAPVEVPTTDGPLTARAANQAIAALLPHDAIVVDEAITSIDGFLEFSAGGAPHDLLRLTGGAIGAGLPLATGAAIGAPGRRVIGLQADGSALYTVQALWTQARERLDVLTVIYANRAYRILEGELRGVGAPAPGPNAQRMLRLDDPAVDWVAVARGFGVEAVRADTVTGFVDALRAGLARRGPFLIEAAIG